MTEECCTCYWLPGCAIIGCILSYRFGWKNGQTSMAFLCIQKDVSILCLIQKVLKDGDVSKAQALLNQYLGFLKSHLNDWYGISPKRKSEIDELLKKIP